ncbi:MAG: PPK2 family polyphosphate kinase [Planctomycetaceae bacterium]
MTDFIKKHVVDPKKRLQLASINTRETEPFQSKDEAKAFTAEAVVRMRELQYRLFVENKQSLLIVLQAPDAAGKDGLIRKVLGRMNPQGCRTYPFKAPTEDELARDFLARIHPCVPRTGQVSIFNRSYYEDVLVVRVEKLVPAKVWQKRFNHINAFESLIADRGTQIIKILLHISPEEQLARFGERLNDPEKHWKLNSGDYGAREKWEDYRKAYEDALKKCSAEHAPWYIIPADHKWYRDAAVAGIVMQTLEKMNPRLPQVHVDLDEIRKLYDDATQAAHSHTPA